MEKIRLLIVEDEAIIAADLERAMKKMDFEVVDVVDTGEDAIAAAKVHTPDLILMDIQLYGDLDGIDTAHEISKTQAIPIIFLTSNTDSRTFNRAKLTQPHGFLSKPFRFTDIKHSIDLAFKDKEAIPKPDEPEETISYQMKDCIFVRSKEHLIKLNLKDILYIEADSCYCNLYTEGGKHTIVSTLKKFESSITYPSFMRIHRSFMVNLDKIDKIGDVYVMVGEKMLSISKNYREHFFQRIPKY